MSYYIDNLRKLAKGLRKTAKKMRVKNHKGLLLSRLRKGVSEDDEYYTIKAAEALESIAWAEECKLLDHAADATFIEYSGNND